MSCSSMLLLMFPLWVLPYRFVGVFDYKIQFVNKSESVYYNNTVVIIAHRCCLCFYLLVVLSYMLICPRCGKIGIGIYEKRVKGYRYLYCAHRLNGKLKWCYIGKAGELSNSLPNSLPNFSKRVWRSAGGGIRTHAALRQRILSPPPLDGWI